MTAYQRRLLLLAGVVAIAVAALLALVPMRVMGSDCGSLLAQRQPGEDMSAYGLARQFAEADCAKARSGRMVLALVVALPGVGAVALGLREPASA